jgi:hypothetical protein
MSPLRKVDIGKFTPLYQLYKPLFLLKLTYRSRLIESILKFITPVHEFKRNYRANSNH